MEHAIDIWRVKHSAEAIIWRVANTVPPARFLFDGKDSFALAATSNLELGPRTNLQSSEAMNDRVRHELQSQSYLAE